MTLTTTFSWLIGGLAALCVLVAASTFAWRVLRRRRDRRITRALDPLRPTAYQLVTGDPKESAEAFRRLEGVDDATWRPLQDLLVGFFGRLSGESLRPVQQLLILRGVLDGARHDLHARSAVRRGRAAHVLGMIGDRAALPDIELLVNDRDPEIRVVACRALARLGDARAAGTLLAALDSSRPVASGMVADALLGMDSPVQDTLRSALTGASTAARGVAADVAGLRGFVTLTRELRTIVATERDPGVRARSATALGRLGVPQALPELADATRPDQPPEVRLAAAEALGLLGEPAAIGSLTPLLDPPSILADTAARALVRLGPLGLQALESAADSGTPSAAAGALAVASLREVTWSR